MARASWLVAVLFICGILHPDGRPGSGCASGDSQHLLLQAGDTDNQGLEDRFFMIEVS